MEMCRKQFVSERETTGDGSERGEDVKMRRGIMIAGTNSGSGKTTVATGILSALKARGMDLSAFKCGPDYIDPMFHRQVLGLPSFNLDPYFLDSKALRELYESRSRSFSVVEGVMGYYDGVGPEGRFSSYAVARALGIPVILVVNAAGMATSAGAILRGFREFREESGIVGVIFNQTSPMMEPFLRKVAEEAGVVSIGCLPKESGISIESRHLGLRTDLRTDELEAKLQQLRALVERHLDLDLLLALGENVEALGSCDRGEADRTRTSADAAGEARPVFAVARDRAFCFLYEENLEWLIKCGANIVYFSPLEDERPPEADALYLPGGYPELFLDELSGNKTMLAAIREAVSRGTPTIAECGGFLYLHREVDGRKMVGVIDGIAYRTPKLQRFGYVELEAYADNLMCEAGECIRSHEFHYYESTTPGEGFRVTRARGGEPYRAVLASESLYAGFPHLYFGANPAFAERVVAAARVYRDGRLGGDRRK